MIEIRNIKKEFIQGSSKQSVLRGIDLTVDNNDFITIMGPSGGGKSTLLYTLALLSEPSSGEIKFDNKIIDFNKEKDVEDIRRKYIGLVFQNHNLISCLSALENIIIAIDSKENYKAKKEKAEKLLRKVGLYEKRNLKATALSGGEAQRVAVVRALDSENGKNVISLLLDMKKELNCALVIVTHDNNIGKIGDRRILLKDGVINEVV